jgi:hypothetical protein
MIEEADDLAAEAKRRRRDKGHGQGRGERERQAVAAASKGRGPSGDLGPASVVRRVGERGEARVQLGLDHRATPSERAPQLGVRLRQRRRDRSLADVAGGRDLCVGEVAEVTQKDDQAATRRQAANRGGELRVALGLERRPASARANASWTASRADSRLPVTVASALRNETYRVS